MNIVLIVPTGIGAAIGGHAGDATPVAKLLGACCDTLITHPNVVNASDINEMPANCLYVDGYMLDEFLAGRTKLQTVRKNRILLVVNWPVTTDTINSVNAAIHTIGADIDLIPLEFPLRMKATFAPTGEATGEVNGVNELIRQVSSYKFDALAIQSEIEVDKEVASKYLTEGGINPWGGVEAKVSRMISEKILLPVAHAPLDSEMFTGQEDIASSRMAAEMVSASFLHCVFKGLHNAPRYSNEGLSVKDVDVLVSPYGCMDAPHEYCSYRNIPIIYVKENTTCLNNIPFKEDIVVENYWEAAGYIMAMRAGINPQTARADV